MERLIYTVKKAKPLKAIRNSKLLLALLALASVVACNNKPEPPTAVGPVPSERQLNWQQLDYYAFIHFNMNTFSNMEWGTGGESPTLFNPSQLDVNQWTNTIKEAGMKGVIITAKHHDGFCLWPTATTVHSVKNSKWQNGKGDLIKDLAQACKEKGLKFGVYLSPWDRNNEYYGKAEYVNIFHNQLRELLTNYGEIFEVWFDGANGGTGYYGGANENRKIDNKTYYQWDKAIAIVRELQPNAVIFGDGGPDVRWVGNEEGWANETNWSTMNRDEIYPGWPKYIQLRSGHEDGTHWLPAEADVSLRPGWYYHPGEDHQVKSLAKLTGIYYNSIGRNANLLLNIPVDNTGLIHEKDAEQLLQLNQQIQKDFSRELLANTKVTATSYRDNHKAFSPKKVLNNKPTTYWATNNDVHTGAITFTFNKPTAVNRLLLQEYIPLGQRIQAFAIEALIGEDWKLIDEQTTIGNKRILRFNTVEASAIRVNILKSKGPIAISNIQAFKAPKLLTPPTISRAKNGHVTINSADSTLSIHYTINGDEPSISSPLYNSSFIIDKSATVKAISYDVESNKSSGITSKNFDVSKNKWKVVSPNVSDTTLVLLIDDNPATLWSSEESAELNKSVIIDMGQNHLLNGFTYWPSQARFHFGIVQEYEFYVSANNATWSKVSEGEFANVLNNRIEQIVLFDEVKARYIKLVPKKVDDAKNRISIAEIGVITSSDL